MQKCPELRKLPKAPLISSVNFRRQTPGSINGLWQGSTSRNRVDRSHPIDLIPGKQKAFIWAPPCNGFTLGAIPIGLLLKPSSESIRRPGQYRTQALYDAQNRIVPISAFDTWAARLERGAATGTIAPVIPNEAKHGRVGMSLQMHSSRDVRTHQRVRILRRFKTAVSLVVTRGAGAKEVNNGRLRLVFDEKDAGEWILPGWTYYLRPGLELYNMPYPELVDAIRPALRDLWKRGMAQEERWTAAALGKADGSRTRTNVGAPKNERAAGSRSAPGAFPGHEATQSTRTTSTSSRHKRTSSEPHAATTTKQSDPQYGQKNRHRSGNRHNFLPESLPATPDFDPFPAVRGTSASPRSSKPVDAHSQTRQVLPVQPDFDPFPNAPRHIPSAVTSALGGRTSPAVLSPRDGAVDSTFPAVNDAARGSATRPRGQPSLAALAADPDFDDFGLDLPAFRAKVGGSEAATIPGLERFSTDPVDVDFESESEDEDEGGILFPTDPDFGAFTSGGRTASNMAAFLAGRGVPPSASASASASPPSTSTSTSGAPSNNPRPALRSSTEAKAKLPPAKTKPEAVDWWAVGRNIEAAIGYGLGEEGSTRWDTPDSPAQPAPGTGAATSDSRSSASQTNPQTKTATSWENEHEKQKDKETKADAEEKKHASTQTRLAGMLFQRNEVVRPDREERAARRIPWQTHRLEEK
ncbi:60S ribosomal protein L18-B [Mycena sanguinolenta]|uniref:60S ribosomal protein L18-B n=1 Tax=Mycena sanguinolenta TaxID=230812 RepID=A0A8H7D936_9AGAR|nr:60S ribosomal protein L18-B [Mycena sanguinolenta]